MKQLMSKYVEKSLNCLDKSTIIILLRVLRGKCMKKIGTKIMVLSIFIAFIAAAAVGISETYETIKTNGLMMSTLDKSLREDFDKQIKYEVDTAISLLDNINKKYENKEISLEQAKKQGADLLRSLRYGKDGYFWADNTEGINIVLLGSSTEGTNRMESKDAKGNYLIKEIIQNGMKDDGGYTDYWFPKKGETKPLPKRSYSRLYKPFGWVIGTGNYVDDIDSIVSAKGTQLQKAFYSGLVTMGMLFVVVIIISAIAVLYFSKKITKPILFITKLVNKTSELDLVYDSEFEVIHQFKDETGIIGEAVINLRKELRNIVGDIKKNSIEVLGYSDVLTTATKENVQSIDAVSIAIEELAKGAVEQSKDSQTGAERVSSLSEEIEEVSRGSGEVKEYSESVKTANLKGIEAIKHLSARLDENSDASKEISENIKILSQKSNSIGNIIGSIEAIAEQTNLLALNAAIEAARAGEAGKGFGVVAEEVRKLAEQTSISTRQISNVIEEIQNEIDKANISMDKGNAMILEVDKSMDQTKTAFSTIEEAIEKTIGQINMLVGNVDNVDKDKDKIVEAIQGISAISEQSAASTEEISASMLEQAQNIEEISKTSEKLKQVVDNLEVVVNKFNI